MPKERKIMIGAIVNWSGKKIWIIGASQGIGRSLAKELLKEGALVYISARDRAALDALSNEMGPNCFPLPFDVTDLDQTEQAIKTLFENWNSIDAIFYAAAVYTRGSLDQLKLEDIKATIETNFIGVVNVLYKVIPHFKQQKFGQIAIIASVAGYSGLPHSNVYGPSKAALINLCEALHIEMLPYNVMIRVINPGFVRTRLTDKNEFPMPFIISADQAAQEIIKGFRKNNFQIDFPKPFTLILKFLSQLPYKLYFYLARKYINSRRQE